VIADLKPYPALKPSGVPWLGEVPEHWEVAPGKRFIRSLPTGVAPIKNVAVGESSPGLVPSFSASGQDVWLPRACGSGSALILSAVGARSGRTFLAPSGEWGLVANTQAFRVGVSQDTRFWWYLVNTPQWWDREGSAQPYVRVAPTLSKKCAVPPSEEQRAIVRFLDWVDGRIGKAVGLKEREIALLEEQKQAIITEAVTRGLDKSVALKPSGVPWLGEVPEHWYVRRAKYLFHIVNQRSRSGREELLSVSARRGVVLRSTASVSMFKAGSYIGHKLCWPGDLVINSLWAWAGGLGFSTDHGLVSTAYSVYRPNAEYVRYANYWNALLRSRAYNWEFMTRSKGVWKSRLQLADGVFMSMRILVPPLDEQEAIVRFLNAETARIDRVGDQLRREVELLGEYRTRLISDLVTGKLDVREAAKGLPEQPGDLEHSEADAGGQEPLEQAEAA